MDQTIIFLAEEQQRKSQLFLNGSALTSNARSHTCCPLHVTFCVHAPRSPSPLLFILHSPTHSHTINHSLASASLPHSSACLVDAAFCIATVACYLFLAALLSSPGSINSFVIKAVSMLVPVIRLCDEKRGHGRIARYDELNKLFWYSEVMALLTLCPQIRLNSSIFHQRSVSCVSTASTGIAHSSRCITRIGRLSICLSN